MIKNRQILRPIGIILFIFVLCIIFIEPLRTKMNNIFMLKDRGELKEGELIGTVLGYNPRVKEVQEVLKNAGFYAGRVDGFMGAQARKAIMNFQGKKGLQVTGKIDQVTLLALNRQSQMVKSDVQEEERVVSKKDGPGDSSGEDLESLQRIKRIQAALTKFNFYKGKIDGIMGPKTKKAIKAFQKSRGLKADGVVGPKTWEELSRYLD